MQLKFKSLKLTTNAALQRRFGSPFVFREEDPSRQVSQDQPPGWETHKKCGAGRCHAAPAALGRLQHRALTLQGKAPRMAEGLEPGTSSSPKLQAPSASPTITFLCSLQITFEISKPEESQIPIWIILGSTLGGLLLLALLVLALWKVSSPLGHLFWVAAARQSPHLWCPTLTPYPQLHTHSPPAPPHPPLTGVLARKQLWTLQSQLRGCSIGHQNLLQPLSTSPVLISGA